MGSFTGPKIPSDNLVFAYDMADEKSYVGKPTVNYIAWQNAVAQTSYTAYEPDATWVGNHPGAIQTVNADGSGTTGYVNTGVGSWQSTKHAHWILDPVLNKPVVRMEDTDSAWKAKYFSRSFLSWQNRGMTTGDSYVVSWLQWTTNLSKVAVTGLYQMNNSSQAGFHDGLKQANSTTRNTKLRTWQRVYAVSSINSNSSLTSTYGAWYMYGHFSPQGEIRIADVQVELGVNRPGPFLPNENDGQIYSEKSLTDGFKDLSNNGYHADLTSLTYGDDDSAFTKYGSKTDRKDARRKKFSFDGSSNYLALPSISGLGNTFTMIAWVRPDNTATEKIIYGPQANGHDNWFSIQSNHTVKILFTESSDTNNTTLATSDAISTTEFSHLSIVMDNSNSSVFIYINGELKASNTSISFTIGGWDGLASIGRRGAISSIYFDGEIHSLRAYGSVFSASQIFKDYTNTKSKFFSGV